MVATRRESPMAKPRLTKAERAALEAERLAQLLADSCDGLDPPAFLADMRMKPALQVWRYLAPYMSKLGCLQRSDRLAFSLLCVYTADFAAAVDDCHRNGFSMKVKTVSGGYMLRDNPALARRDVAAKMMLDLAQRFGLSPLDRHKLFAVQGRAPEAPLFGDEGCLRVPRPAPDVGAAEPSEWDRLLARDDAAVAPKPN